MYREILKEKDGMDCWIRKKRWNEKKWIVWMVKKMKLIKNNRLKGNRSI